MRAYDGVFFFRSFAKSLVRGWCLACSLLCATLAHANFPPTSSVYYLANGNGTGLTQAEAETHFQTGQEACEVTWAGYIRIWGEPTPLTAVFSAPNVCYAGPTYGTKYISVLTEKLCGVGGVLASANSCTCLVDYVESGGVCLTPAQVAASVVDGLNSVDMTLTGSGGGLDTCYGGAAVHASGSASGGGVTEYYGPFTVGSGDCSGVADAVERPLGAAACSPDQVFGQINGVDTCVTQSGSVASGPAITASAPSAGSSAPVIAGAPAGSVSATSTTDCQGGSCTTTTTYRDAGGASLGTVSVDSPQSSVCTVNPNMPGCSAGKSECELHPDSVGCASFGEVPADGIPTASKSLSYVPDVTGLSSGSCPAPISVHTSNGDVVLDLTDYCSALETYAKPVIILLAMLTAIFIVTPGRAES